jgi:regulator of protease activity HflC (stomatin/prohibitin superfamily)
MVMDGVSIYLVLFILVVILAKTAIVVIPQQHAYVIERMGKYHETLIAGMNFIVPFVDNIAYRHTLKEVPYDVDPQVCITRDNSQVKIDGILYYQITDAKLASYGTSNYQTAIEQLAKTTLRSEVGRRDLDKLLEERSAINNAVVAALDEASTGWGVKVLRYEVKDIEPPQSVLRAMEMQITAEREKRALVAKSEGERAQAVNVAEGQKSAAVARSEGDRQAAVNQASGQAEAILMVARANAEAIRLVAEALELQGGDRAASLKVAEQYVAAFANIAKTGTTVVIPSNLADLSGLIQGALAVLPKKS